MREIKNVIIAGAGIMGSSIAQVFAVHGVDVQLYYNRDHQYVKSSELIRLNQETMVRKEEITQAESDVIMSHISYTNDENSFDNADFVLETIREDMQIKHDFWKMVCAHVADDVILTSNTSGLSITKIAEAITLPERFCGFHWVNPPHLVPLVEIISGDATNPEILQATKELAIKIGKKPVIVKKDAPGFILNRIQFSVLREAMHIVESGIGSLEDVDAVLNYGLGMRYAALGPFQIADLGGLDTFYAISSYLFEDLSDAKKPHKMLCDIVENGDYGVKNCKGFYDYSGGKDSETIKKRDEDFIKIANCMYK